MGKAFALSIVLGCSAFIVRVSTYIFPDFIAEISLMILLSALLIVLMTSVVKGPFVWRRRSGLWLLPAVTAFIFFSATIYAAPATARVLSDRIFRRHLEQYSGIVREFSAGRTSCIARCDANLEEIKASNLPPRVLDVWGMHCSGGGVIVLFRRKNETRMLHEGYMFKNYASTSDCDDKFGDATFKWEHLPFVRHIGDGWYRFSDQPGF